MRFKVIMPTLNQGAFIDDALRSVVYQLNVDVDLVVYDSCSSDSTSDILEKYRDKITWIREKDRGQIDAINRGFKLADGDILAWLNSDDAYLPDALKKVHQAFIEDAKLDFVFGDALEIDTGGKILHPNLFTEAPDRERYLFSHNFICQPTFFFRRRILPIVGWLREDLLWAMDYEWFGRFFLNDLKGKQLPQFLAVNRHYISTKTNTGGFRRCCEYLSVIRHRPGDRLWRRAGFGIYIRELQIKELTRLSKAVANPFVNNILKKYLKKRHHGFINKVDPKRRSEIESLYRDIIANKGDTLAAQWNDWKV